MCIVDQLKGTTHTPVALAETDSDNKGLDYYRARLDMWNKLWEEAMGRAPSN